MTKRKTVGWLVFAALMAVMLLQLPRIVGDGFYVVGMKFHSAGNYEAAAKAFQGAVFLNPRMARAHVELGSSYLGVENYRRAEQAFLKARSLQDESCASCGLGMTYAGLRRYDDAEKAFKRAETLNPTDFCAYNQSGRMYYARGKYQEAIAAFKRVLTLRPNFATYMYLGNSYVYAKQYEDGVEAYKEVIRRNPKDAGAHIQLGIAYGYLERYEEAVGEYKQALELDPKEEDAHNALILAYLSLRNRPAALAQYEVLRKLSPEKAAELFEDSALLQERELGKEKLYLIPVGSFANGRLTKLVNYYKQKPGINVLPTEVLPLGLPAVDKRRNQVIAEEVIELMKRRFPKLAADPNAVLIALTDEDIYTRKKTWQYTFCYRTQGRFAVVSSARLNPVNLGEAANNDLLDLRMRKMVLKNIGLLYYRLPTSPNPSSVLYGDVQGVEDLDKMGEDF